MNYQDGGTETQLFVGIKAGVRRERYGLFGKVRPGVSNFARTYGEELTVPSPRVRGWDFSGDFGAVLEVYPAGKHLLLRGDFGEVLTLFHAVAVPTGDQTLTQPAMTRASLLFVTGAGWRF